MKELTEKQKHILTEYLEQLVLQKRGTAERKSSITRYFYYLNDHDIDLYRITIQEAQEYQQYLSLLTCDDGSCYYGRSTVLTIIGRVSSFYDYLKQKNKVPFNPFKEIARLRKEKRLPRDILSEDDMHRVLSELKDFTRPKDRIKMRQLYKAHVIAEVMYSTGARIHEIAALKISDLDFARGIIRLHDRKTGTERPGILNSFAERVLRLHVEEMRKYVLTGKSDRSLLFGSSNNLYKWLNKIMTEVCTQLELKPFKSHDFRHSAASHLLKNGCDVRFIQEILGHASIATTQVYTRVVKDDLKGILDTYHPRSLERKSGNETL